MSKLICDICGTEYPETEDCCPVCSAPRAENVLEADVPKNHDNVKGGRYAAPGADKTNRNLVILLLVLLLAIACVLAFIVVRIVGIGEPGGKETAPSVTDPSPSQTQTAPTTVPTIITTEPTEGTTLPPEIPCTGIKLNQSLYMLDTYISSMTLPVTVYPEDTTDEIFMTSDNEKVLKIDEDGTLVAVATGQATVTVTCGAQQVKCVIVCYMNEPTTPENEKPTQSPSSKLTFNTYDVTCSVPKESFKISTGSILATDVKWTSDDPSIATVSAGRVTAVGVGTTKIRGEYKGVVKECIVRCKWLVLDDSKVEFTAAGQTNKIDDKSPISSSKVTWSSSNTSVATVKNGVITAVGEGTATITAKYKTVKVECKVTCVWATEPPTEPSTDATEPSTEVTTPSTEATTPSTEGTTPSTEATDPSTEATTPSTEATTPSTEATTPSTEATTPSTVATTPSTEATTPSTEATSPSTEATTASSAQETGDQGAGA